MTIQVTTNNVPRPIIYGYELSAKEAEGFGYMEEELASASFFRYKGKVYPLTEFVIASHEYFGNADLRKEGWDGYSSETFFSGVVVKYCDDYESVVVGSYYYG